VAIRHTFIDILKKDTWKLRLDLFWF
jgi:hypothetical protein